MPRVCLLSGGARGHCFRHSVPYANVVGRSSLEQGICSAPDAAGLVAGARLALVPLCRVLDEDEGGWGGKLLLAAGDNQPGRTGVAQPSCKTGIHSLPRVMVALGVEMLAGERVRGGKGVGDMV